MPEVDYLAESIPHQLFLPTISQDPDHSAWQHSIPEILTQPSGHSEDLQHPRKKMKWKRWRATKNPFPGLKDFTPQLPWCCQQTALSYQPSWESPWVKSLLLRSHAPFPGQPTSKDELTYGIKKLSPLSPARDSAEKPFHFQSSHKVRSPLRLHGSLPSPLPNTGFFFPFLPQGLIPRALSNKIPEH